nr:Flp family type IVb pilin [Sphingobium xanthum]
MLTSWGLHIAANRAVAEEFRVRAFLHRIRSCKKGATAVEYGLILAMVVLAMIGALSNVASKTNGMWTNVANEVNNH